MLRQGFTLMELMVVIVILGIVVMMGGASLNTALLNQKQAQAAEIIGNTIRNVRSFALAYSVDPTDQNYYDSGYALSTRNAFAVYFFQGWVSPKDETVNEALGLSDNEYAFSYSIYPVRDPGYDFNNRTRGPNHPDVTGMSYMANITGIKQMDAGNSKFLAIRRGLIALPEGVILLYPTAADNGITAAGNTLGGAIGAAGMEWITYDQSGQLITHVSDYSGTYNAFTSAGMDGNKTYIAIAILDGDSINPNITPLYIDLRTGDLIPDPDNIQNIGFPVFH
jgi:prepilin-type N-terminal cleavage/methylation domain-containing protein